VGRLFFNLIKSTTCFKKKFFAIPDNAKNSASVDDKVTLLPDSDFHAIGAPQK
jgi:hypothetical protein